MGKEARAWIGDMFNHRLEHGIPYDLTTDWIKSLQKGGDIYNVNTYRTITVGLLMEKLDVMESKVSVWVEKNSK